MIYILVQWYKLVIHDHMIARALQFSLLKAQECLDGLLEEWWSWWKVVVMISKSSGPYWTSWIFVNDQDCWPLLFGRVSSPSATCQVLNVLGKWVHKHSTPCVLTFSRRSGSRPVSDLSAHNKRLPRQGMAPVFPCSMLTYYFFHLKYSKITTPTFDRFDHWTSLTFLERFLILHNPRIIWSSSDLVKRIVQAAATVARCCRAGGEQRSEVGIGDAIALEMKSPWVPLEAFSFW